MPGELVSEEADPGGEDALAEVRLEQCEKVGGAADRLAAVVEHAVPDLQAACGRDAEQGAAAEVRARSERLEHGGTESPAPGGLIELDRLALVAVHGALLPGVAPGR